MRKLMVLFALMIARSMGLPIRWRSGVREPYTRVTLQL